MGTFIKPIQMENMFEDAWCDQLTLCSELESDQLTAVIKVTQELLRKSGFVLLCKKLVERLE